MKKLLLSFMLLALLNGVGFAAKHTITNVGTTFSPDSIGIAVGDTVTFTISSSHNAVEVTKATWDADGITPKAGGFNVPYGGGSVSFATAGIRYYVCQTHASLGMKGIINVGNVNAISTVTSDIPAISVYPDPSVDFFTVSYSLGIGSAISIKLINIAGVEVRDLYNDYQIAGDYKQIFYIANGLSEGIYFISINSANGSTVKKLLIR